MSLSMKIKKEVQIIKNGYNQVFYIVHDFIKSEYQIETNLHGSFARAFPDLFKDMYLDEKSALSTLKEKLEEYNPGEHGGF
ncbi:hypothetical protein ABF162_13730 [Vibrio coralliilyticus]|uniref:hypothetical protein n=1 Tax=Vibrio coralliilyticus TaxID=190893 RepID=UPI0005126BAD|nr:hypothetical protein [Vibrio coralliilyticus]AIU67942.1 hypothetical protein JV59_37595 [Vibrio coralliilyticus]